LGNSPFACRQNGPQPRSHAFWERSRSCGGRSLRRYVRTAIEDGGFGVDEAARLDDATLQRTLLAIAIFAGGLFVLGAPSAASGPKRPGAAPQKQKPRPHRSALRARARIVQTKAQRRESDALQVCHWTISLLKRWLLGTHAGAVAPKHLQAYLDEYAFRHNRRKTNGVGRIAARVIEQPVAHPPPTIRSLIDDTRRCRWLGPAHAGLS
jgi:ISXO2-like transposase domain